MDVHSLSLLVRSNVSGLKLSVALLDNAAANSLVTSATITSSNTWTIIQLPNLPVWRGTYSATPGQRAYMLIITLACGTTYLAAPSNAWQSSLLFGETGMSNFLATAGATFDIGFVQHEPGPVCSTLIDKPFTQNLDECLRYFQKSYSYAEAPGKANAAGYVMLYTAINQSAIGWMPFKKIMAKIPNISGWATDGTANSVRDAYAGLNRGITGVYSVSDSAFTGFSLGSTNAAVTYYNFHYQADTGW